MNSRVWVVALVHCLVVAGALANQQPLAAESVRMPPLTPRAYDDLKKLPDWSGWWYRPRPAADAPLVDGPRDQAPLNPVAAAKIAAAFASTADRGNLQLYCQPFRFVGENEFPAGFETLLTPGRVTITNSQGMVRRIYTDGRPLPQKPDDNLSGTSVGHWEHQTLVVETTGIDPTAAYPWESLPGAPEVGKGVHISERMSLKDTDTLQIDMVMIAPELLTGPYKRTTLFKRDRNYEPTQFTGCLKHDRLVDPATGKQRFDLTPPEDLPPPPQ